MQRSSQLRGGQPRAGGRRSRAAAVTGALALIGAVALAAAPSAQGALPGPVGALGGAIDAGLGAVTGGFGGLAVEGFGGIVKALFAWPAKLVNRELLAWLVAVPDYAVPASSGPAGRRGGELAELAATTQTMAFAALGAVGTVAGVRYWAAGLTGSGGMEALEGLARTVAAALAIVAWPWLFRNGAELANAAGRGLLGSERVLEDTARMLASAFAAAVAFNVLAILVALAAAVLLLMLLVAKIAVSAGTALVFVGMPLALLLWPLPELAWVARAALRIFGIVLAIPLAWAVSFATFAAVGVDALAYDGAGGVGDKLLTPLVALALLWLTATLPRSLMRAAMSGVGSASGTVSRTTSRVVARQIDGALASGTRPSVSAAGQPARTATGGGSSAAAEGAASAGAARTGGAGAAGAAATTASGGAAALAVAAGAAGRGGGWRAPIDVPAPDTSERSGGGLPRPSPRGLEMFAALLHPPRPLPRRRRAIAPPGWPSPIPVASRGVDLSADIPSHEQKSRRPLLFLVPCERPTRIAGDDACTEGSGVPVDRTHPRHRSVAWNAIAGA